MMRKKIAIIDVIGSSYDAKTIEKYGLGGSESAVIYMAKELQALDFEVTVFNNCTDSRASEGTYDGVRYVDLRRLYEPNEHTCDIMVVSRTVVPFLPEHLQDTIQTPHPSHIFSQLKNSSQHKILWLHDTFCSGDHLVEHLVVNGYIDEIFTLSDFHTAYVTNCDHGNRRNFEVLKNKVFVTRNGAKKYIDEVDIEKKNKNLFIYNASVTKGMLPLINDVWPKIKQQIPNAQLRIVGGYYRFRDGAKPDAQEEALYQISQRKDLSELGITLLGVIPQSEVARHLAEASFMIFPTLFPETFGISSLESLLYNTPLLTNRFGALEETAVDLACYKIDYPIEANGLFRNINKEEQVNKFVDMVLRAYHDNYLHAQKMQYCNIVHDIAGWNTVALQWKQHILRKIGLYLPRDEYKKVMYINNRIHQIFGKRFSNPEEWEYTRTNPQQHIDIISPFYNAEKYIRECILSVASQDYDEYVHHLIDDCSTDNGFNIARETILTLPEYLQKKFRLTRTAENQGAVKNQVETIRQCGDNAIIMMLDGDDCLMPNNTILHLYNSIYTSDIKFTYGSMWSMADNIPLIAQPYPKKVSETKGYRDYKFPWNMPYTHLRTFRKHLLNNIDDKEFKHNENWLRAGGDTAIFYNLLEQVTPEEIKVVTDVVYKYNDLNPLNDYKVNGNEQTSTAQMVMNKSMKKKILLAIPTAKYIEPQTFKSIYDLIVPENYEIDFQYFYGYNIDQVRNLIAHWAIQYDYLFSVDSDIVLPQDSLVKMLHHNVDMVSGVYIQRKKDVEIVEVYRQNAWGGVSNVPLESLYPAGLHEIDGCGFGCVLVRSDVIRKIGYPQFEYHSAIDHKDTVSEDVDFCRKAKQTGARIFVDSTIICDHIGNTTYTPRKL